MNIIIPEKFKGEGFSMASQWTSNKRRYAKMIVPSGEGAVCILLEMG